MDWFCLKHSSDLILLIMDYLEGMVLQNMYILDPVCEKNLFKGTYLNVSLSEGEQHALFLLFFLEMRKLLARSLNV